MRRPEAKLYFYIVLCVGFGLAGLYLGFIGNSTVCDPSCRPHAAGTIEPFTTLVSALFLGVGIWLLYRTLTRRNPQFRATRLAGGEGLGEQARLAQSMRAFYTHPAHPMGNLLSPTEFDRLILSLFDSIEAGAGDIDGKIDALGTYVRNKGFWRGYGDRLKAHVIWSQGAATLQWTKQTDEIWQLRCNWNRLLRVANLGPWWKDGHTVAPTWITPTRNEAGVGVAS
jgi:hypothetical protein